MTIWFSSDLHLGHENIINFCSRPFANAKEMDEALLDWHNELVKTSDHWYNLGDVTMLRGGRVQQTAFITQIKKFNGHKRLLLGNHDHFPPRAYLDAGFEKIFATHRMDNFILSHIPLHPASLGGVKANVHGHIHNAQGGVYKPALAIHPKHGGVVVIPYINLSVEVINYRPVSLEQLQKMIKTASAE